MNDRDNVPSGNMPDLFDRMLGSFDGLPDVIRTKPSTIRFVEPIVGNARTFIVQTVRQADVGETIFIEVADGSVRLVIPPTVSAVIARQRDSVLAQARRRSAKRAAETRERLGIQPGFLKKKGAKK